MTRVSRRVILAAARAAGTTGARARGDLTGMALELHAAAAANDAGAIRKLAAAEGRLEILRLCLKAGANLKDTNRYGGTALIPAAHHGHPETVRELLKTYIAIDHVNRLSWTALLETIILSDGGPTHQDILVQLIAAGADVNLADGEGVAPLAHAKNRGYSDMIRMLEAAGAR